MKRIVFTLILLSQVALINAQSQTRKSYTKTERITEWGYSVPWDRGFPVEFVYDYYYDKDDNEVLDGVAMAAAKLNLTTLGFRSGSLYYAAVMTFKDDKLNGGYGFEFEDSYMLDKGSVKFDAVFADDIPVDHINLIVRNTIGDNKESLDIKVKLDDQGNKQKISYVLQEDGIKIEMGATYDLDGKCLSGFFDADGDRTQIKNDVITDFLFLKTGGTRALEASEKEMLDSYFAGDLTRSQLLERGYALRRGEWRHSGGIIDPSSPSHPRNHVKIRYDEGKSKQFFPLGLLSPDMISKQCNITLNPYVLTRVNLVGSETLIEEYRHTGIERGSYDSNSYTLKRDKETMYVLPDEYEKYQSFIVQYNVQKIKSIMEKESRPSHYLWEYGEETTKSSYYDAPIREGVRELDVFFMDGDYQLSQIVDSFNENNGVTTYCCKYVVELKSNNSTNGYTYGFRQIDSAQVSNGWETWRELRKQVLLLDEAAVKEIKPSTPYTKWRATKSIRASHSLEESLSRLKSIHEAQKHACAQIVLIRKIHELDGKLTAALEKKKSLNESYVDYWNRSNLSLVPEDPSQTEKLKTVLSNQAIVLEALGSDKIDSKRERELKKQADQSFESIIATIQTY